MLMVQDMARAISFYRDVLGFEESLSSPEWSEVRFGDAVVGLHAGADGSQRKTGLSIQYQDVRKAFDRAVEAGATVLQEPQQREGEPILLASIADPEGNVIMLTQYVGEP